MRIAVIATSFCPIPPEKYGGTEVMVDSLVRGLHAAGQDVKLIALEGSTSPVPIKEIVTGAQPHAFSSLSKESSYILNAYEELSGNYDVIHDNSGFGPAYARAFPDLPVVRTEHGPFAEVLNVINERLSPWVAAFVAISHSQASTAPVPTTVIHHGVDTDRFSYGDGTGDDKGEYLFSLGRMQPIKGPHIAARLARKTGKRLVIAAKMREPREIEYFEKEVEPLLGDEVEFIGEVGGQEKTDLMNKASALINPIQWSEPFGLTMAEALSCGTPVLTFNRGSAPEIIDTGKTGFVCETEDELAASINKIDQIDRQVCRKRATDYFNIHRMAADYVKVYEQAIERNPKLRAALHS